MMFDADVQFNFYPQPTLEIFGVESGTVCCRCQFHCIACIAICECGPKQRCARLAAVGLCFACYFDLLFKGPGIVSWVADKIASRIITSWLCNVVGSFLIIYVRKALRSVLCLFFVSIRRFSLPQTNPIYHYQF